MHILILNWRDTLHPRAGGAEKLNMHLAQILLSLGHSVTWYASTFMGCKTTEDINGVHVVRFGNNLIHYLIWPVCYWRGLLGKPDLVIDCIHGVGYFTPLIIPKIRKKILICEVAQNIWDEMLAFPFSRIGKLMEKIMLRIYRRQDFLTISQSTKTDLIRFGVQATNIEIIPMGFDGLTLPHLPQKYRLPTALFVGRLCEMKGIKDALMAISRLKHNHNQSWQLRVVGRGEVTYEQSLLRLATDLGISAQVIFTGFVPDVEKFQEMAKAWVLLVPSSREGWGMIVPEANSVGTPAIGYNVPGLRDVLPYYSSQNILIEPNPTKLAQAMSQVQSPIKVKPRRVSGWGELTSFVKANIL